MKHYPLRRLLKPIARLAIKSGFKVQELYEELKIALCEVAQEQLSKQGEKATVSKLAVLTGLQRKDLKRILSSVPPKASSVNLLTKIIGQWQAHSDFSQRGKARDLSLRGPDSEFSSLVRTVSADLNPASVLFGLQQAKVVEVNSNRVRLIRSEYFISSDQQQGLEVLAEDAAALLEAAAQNIFEMQSIPHLHMSTIFDNLCLDRLDHLREWVLNEGTKFHRKVRQYLSRFDKDSNPTLHKKQGGARMTVCAFSLATGGGRDEKAE